MTEDDLAICVTTGPRSFPAGQIALRDIIRQIIASDAWTLDDDLLPSFIASCHMCLLEAGAKPGALHNLALMAADEALKGFHGGIVATLSLPVPGVGGDGAGDGEGDTE